MKVKDLQVELRLNQNSTNPNICRVMLRNLSAEVISNPEIEFLVESGQRLKDTETFKVSQQDGVFVIGHFPAATSISAGGKFEFDVDVTPPITKDNCPKYFFVGFSCAEKEDDPFFAKSEWENKTSDEYANCTVTLANNTNLTLEDPLITFETLRYQTVTEVKGGDIQAHGQKSRTLVDHQVNFAEFSGGEANTRFPKEKRQFTIGINKSNSTQSIALPTQYWVGFDMLVVAFQC